MIRPARECLFNLAKSHSPLIVQKKTHPFLKNLVDTISLAAEVNETYRVMLNDQLNIYHTNVASRQNEMFRVLTIWSVVFVPLTFIAGVYGMNFDFLPELHIQYAYPAFWGVVLTVALLMLYYFKRKGWL